jgi:hypothetical protein
VSAPVSQLPAIDASFSATLVREDSVGGWTVVRLPGSSDLLGTRQPVKVAGTIDGHPFATTMLPMGDGSHILPVKAALRKTIGKEAGAEVAIHLNQRFT